MRGREQREEGKGEREGDCDYLLGMLENCCPCFRVFLHVVVGKLLPELLHQWIVETFAH